MEHNNNSSDIIFYRSAEGNVKVEVFYSGETLNIFESGELIEESVISILETTAADGKNYTTKLYNLDAIIGVGYRVNSKQATDFRIWATKILKDFIVKGFVLDSQRLKNGPKFGQDYFDELLEKIREIRAIRWYNYNDVISHIKIYNTERIELFKFANKKILEYEKI